MSSEPEKTITFRCPHSLAVEFKRKAKNNDQSVSGVLRGFVKGYVGINTDLDELEEKEKGLIDKKSQINAELDQIRRGKEQIKESNRLDEEIVNYLSGPFQKQSSKKIQEKRIQKFAEQYEMEPKEFVEWAEEEVEGFDGF